MKKAFLTLTTACLLLSLGCKQEKKSLAQIRTEAQQIIEYELSDDPRDTITKVFDLSLGRVTDYKYEGTFKLLNQERYDVAVYFDGTDPDGQILVRWRPSDVFGSF